jgi:hypothetical protein
MPTWIKEAQALGSVVGGIAAAVIAYAGIRISDRQSRTAEQKLRLDMFPLRYAVYDAVLIALRDAINEDTSESAQARYGKANMKLREARFLFERETFDYLDNLGTTVFRQRYLIGNISDHMDGVERAALLKEKYENALWLEPQLQNLAKMLEAELKIDAASTFSLKGSPKPSD